MKITVYTIKDCAFSKQEKEYLNTNKLVFEEKDLETNKDFLTEMLAISNNFAGTPVTRVEKDDGTISVLKGFTKEEFDTTFGFTVAPTTNQEVQTPNLGVSTNEPTAPPSINDTPIPPTAEVPPEVPPVVPVESVEATPDPLKSVMDDLQAKVDSALPPVIPVEQPSVEPVNPPTPPADPNAPAIPDFPAK
ncbi:MAG: hypothetical protein ACD_12C00034G0007 [uncultured bacterium]|nr:MAG: hypothetical protein ACD_12C00034G0007 [uncultured bacterium]